MMDVEAGEECSVSGALALVLRMSRVAGVAPLQLRKVRGGLGVRVSDTVHLYGQTLAVLLCVLTVTVYATDLMIEPQRSARIDSDKYHWTSIVEIGFKALVTLSGAFTGKQRMKSMIENLNHVQKITQELNYYRLSRTIEKKKWLLFIVITFAGFTAALGNYSLSLYENIENHGKVYMGVAYIFHDVQFVLLILLEIQFALITLTILTTLEQLNGCLEELLAEIRSGSRKPSSKLTPETVHRLSYLHGCICEAVRQVDSGHGRMVLLVVFSAIFYLMVTLYNIINSYYTLEVLMSFHNNPMRQVLWGIIHFCRLFAVVEPCHRTQDAMEKINELVSQITLNAPRHGDLAEELALFYRHLYLNDTAYRPMDMFTVNRQLVVTMLSTITTYLVIVEQLK